MSHRCGMNQILLLENRVIIWSNKDTGYEGSILLVELKVNEIEMFFTVEYARVKICSCTAPPPRKVMMMSPRIIY